MKIKYLLVALLVMAVAGVAFFAGRSGDSSRTASSVPGSGKGPGDGSGGGKGGGKDSKKGDPVEVSVFAAASTQDVLDMAMDFFKREYNVNFRTNYASSGQLARQIVDGAPADMFISANKQWMDEIEKAAAVVEKDVYFSNELVLIVSKGNPEKITTLEDLNSPRVKRIAIGEPQSVPAGIYAKESLEHYKLWDAVNPKIVSASNVRTALTFVERGEAEAGIVYKSDLKATDQVEAVYTLPSDSHSPIEYPVAILKHGEKNGMVRKFYAFLGSHYSDKIFRTYGFATNFKERQQKQLANQGESHADAG